MLMAQWEGLSAEEAFLEVPPYSEVPEIRFRKFRALGLAKPTLFLSLQLRLANHLKPHSSGYRDTAQTSRTCWEHRIGWDLVIGKNFCKSAISSNRALFLSQQDA